MSEDAIFWNGPLIFIGFIPLRDFAPHGICRFLIFSEFLKWSRGSIEAYIIPARMREVKRKLERLVNLFPSWLSLGQDLPEPQEGEVGSPDSD